MKQFAFLLNPPTKKGKIRKIKKAKRKIAKKVAKKVKRKIAKKVARKVTKVARKVRRIKRKVAKKVTKKVTKKVARKFRKIKRSKKMARRKKYNYSRAIGTKHRISVKKVKKGYQIGKKSKLLVRSRGKILNPFNMGQVTNTLLEAGMIVAGMVGATIIPNKVLPAQYVTGTYAKPIAQIGTGVVMYYLVKKFLKKNKIAEDLLMGAVITVVKEMVDTYVVPKLNAPTVNGLKINGLKLGNANAQKPLIQPSNIRPDLQAPVSSLNGVTQTRSVGARRV